MPIGPMWGGGGMGPGFPQGGPQGGPPQGPPTGPPMGPPQGPPMGLPPSGGQAKTSGPIIGGPPTPPPGAPPDASAGMPLGITPEILKLIMARMAKEEFRTGPDDSLIPKGGGLASMKSGDYD
jgi:hypothetical protein